MFGGMKVYLSEIEINFSLMDIQPHQVSPSSLSSGGCEQ